MGFFFFFGIQVFVQRGKGGGVFGRSLESGGLPRGSSGKEPAGQHRRHKRCWFDPWVGKIPGEGNGHPLQYSCLENPIDRSWQAAVRGACRVGLVWAHTGVSSNAWQAHPGPHTAARPRRRALTRVVGWAHTHVVVDPVHTGGVVLAVVVLTVVWVDLTPLPLEAQRAGAALGTCGWGQGSGSGGRLEWQRGR